MLFWRNARISLLWVSEKLKPPEPKFRGFMYNLYSCQQQTDIGGGNGEEQRVYSIESTTVTGDKIAEIFNADHTLEQRFGQITNLTHGGCQQRGEHAKTHGDGVISSEDIIQQNTGNYRGKRAGNAAFNGLFGADMRGKLMLTEGHAAKEGKAVANPCGGTCQYKGLPPDITDADNKDEPEK